MMDRVGCVNGVNVETLALASSASRSSARAGGISRCTAHVRWVGDLRYEVYADGQTFNFTAESEDFANTKSGLNAAPHFLAWIGISLCTRYVANAAAQSIKIESLDVWVEGVINALTKDQASDVAVKVYLRSDDPEDTIMALHENIVQTSPFSEALTNHIDLTVEKIAPDWSGLTWCEPR